MAEFKVNKNRVAKNTIALYMRMAFTMAISFITARVILQQLGVDDYGLNNLVGSVVSFLSFLNTSIGMAIQRFYSIEIGKGDDDGLKKVFKTGLYLHCIIAIITVLLLELFAVFFLHRMNIPSNRLFAAHVVFQFSVVQFAISILSVPYAAMLRAREYFDKIALLDVIQAVLRLGVIFLLIHINYDKLITIALLNFLVSILYTAGILIFAWRLEEVHATPYRDRVILRQLFTFVSMLIISTMASLGKTQGLVVLINLFFGLAINAAYAIAAQVSHIMNTFVLNFKVAMVPQLVSSYGAGDVTTMRTFINYGTKVTGLMMLFISLPVIFESQFILEIWLKTPPAFSADLVSLVVININISQLTYFHYQAIQATGKITRNQTVLTFLYVMSLISYYIAFKFGADFFSAMYINFIISCLIVSNGLYYSQKLFGYNIKDFLISVLLKLVLTAAIIVISLLLIKKCMEPSFVRFIVIFLTSSVLLIIFGLYLLFDINEREKIFHVLKDLNKIFK